MTREYCPIWGSPFTANVTTILQDGMTYVENSKRVGVPYRIARDGSDIEIDRVSARVKARLTTWIIDESSKGVDWPTVTIDMLDIGSKLDDLSAQSKADRLIRFLVEKCPQLSDTAKISKSLPVTPAEVKNPDLTLMEAMARSQSTTPADVSFLLEELINQGYINRTGPVTYRVTMEGRNRVESPSPNVNSTQAFVAMWFDPSMDELYETGIKPSIIASGYRPLRIDENPEVDRIDDETLEQIAASKFIVAEFTHGEEGPRGSVYFEAGYARALGIPSIYICHTDLTDSLPFDTRQYKHLTWEEPENIVDPLKETILNRFGEGPLTE